MHVDAFLVAGCSPHHQQGAAASSVCPQRRSGPCPNDDDSHDDEPHERLSPNKIQLEKPIEAEIPGGCTVLDSFALPEDLLKTCRQSMSKEHMSERSLHVVWRIAANA